VGGIEPPHSPYLELFFLVILWKTLFRVFENSPNFCPTISSLTLKGIKIFPLCTRNSFPTSFGSIIDRRDQIRLFSKVFLLSPLSISEKKPFQMERDMFFYIIFLSPIRFADRGLIPFKEYFTFFY
jgi:hypothetical protein